MSISEQISRYRKAKGMTQEELAYRLNITPQAVSKWERGVGLPDVSLLGNICEVLQISADALLGIEKDSIVENHDRSMEREIKNNLFAEPLLLEFGEALIPCVVEGLKTDLVNQSRKQLVQETGMLMPLLRLRDNVDLKPEEFVIKSYDRIIYKVKVDKVDDTTYPVMIEQVAKVCREQYDSILNKQLVKQLIDQLKEFYPGVADGLVPEKIGYLKLLRHLQSVVRERGNIRDMIHILEELEEAM